MEELKKEAYNSFVEKLCNQFEMTRKEFFEKSKLPKHTIPRSMLYLLCYNRQVPGNRLLEYLAEDGFPVDYTTIVNGRYRAIHKNQTDVDYREIYQSIEGGD